MREGSKPDDWYEKKDRKPRRDLEKGLKDVPAASRGPEWRPCYKVITMDRHDEIVEVQASLMVGVAKEICLQQKQKRGKSWQGTLGILNS